MVHKKAGKTHKRIDFHDGAYSDRIVLPGVDNVNVKVTRFHAPKGWLGNGLNHPWDEVVHVLQGSARIGTSNGRHYCVAKGDTYVLKAGEKFDLAVDADLVALCVFSQSLGPAVSNE